MSGNPTNQELPDSLSMASRAANFALRKVPSAEHLNAAYKAPPNMR